MRKRLRIVFAGTPEFAAAQLAALLEHGYPVRGVFTQPDRPAGRGRKLRAGAVKRLAESHGLPVYQPATLQHPAVVGSLTGLEPDVVVVAAYGLILPGTILAVPPLGCVNVHASLLPRWRGAAPIQHAILAGDTETGISIFRMDEGMDTGPVLRRAACPIHADDTAGSLHDRLTELGVRTLLETLEALSAGRLEPAPQDEAQATYAPRIRKSDARIDWSRPADEIARRVRAFNPWPVAHTRLGDSTLRIWEVRALDEPASRPAGTVVRAARAGIDVATGEGLLRVSTLQRPGSRVLPSAEFLNAHPLEPGTAFR